MRKGSLLFFIVGILVVVCMVGSYAAERMDVTEAVQEIDNGEGESVQEQQPQEEEQLEEEEESDFRETSEEIGALISENVDSENRRQFEEFLQEFNVPEEYVKQIFSLVKQGYQYRDIMIMYDFLSENYGSMDELTTMLAQQKNGDDLPQLFDDYLQSKEEYTLKDFPEGEIDRLLSHPNIEIEDILIADIMAQEAEVSFEEVMDPLTSGETWQQVAVRVGSLKCDGNVNQVTANTEEIEEYVEQYDVSRQKAAAYLSIEKKTNKKQTRSGFLGLVKTTNSPGQMMTYYLEEKYQ